MGDKDKCERKLKCEKVVTKLEGMKQKGNKRQREMRACVWRLPDHVQTIQIVQIAYVVS
jgi:hypothetical protein